MNYSELAELLKEAAVKHFKVSLKTSFDKFYIYIPEEKELSVSNMELILKGKAPCTRIRPGCLESYDLY